MEDITVQELKQKIDNNEDFLFIDVREPYEYQEFNLDAQLIPLSTLPSRLVDLKEHQDREIIIHCRSGARSGNAKMYLMSQGYSKVRNVLGGVIAWKEMMASEN